MLSHPHQVNSSARIPQCEFLRGGRGSPHNVSSLYQKVGLKNWIKLAGIMNDWRKKRLEKDDVADF